MSDTVPSVAVTIPSRRSKAISRDDAAALLADIDRGVGLPTPWFTDPDLFEAELAGVHRRSWHFAGHSGEVAEPGDVTTYLQYAGKGFDIGSVDVVAPGRIRFRHVCFMPKGTPAETLELGGQILAADPTIWQDVGICNRVQVGHNSGVAKPGRTLAEPEVLLQRMHRLIVEMVTEPTG